MTQREKDWVIKIQLLQLHTDNPYVDDYYYTTWKLRQAVRDRERKQSLGLQPEGGDTEPQLLLPQLAKNDSKAYKPVQFEGSLGRLTSSSVHNPRKILDISLDRPDDSEDPKARMGRRFKLLLLDVEKCFDLMLEVDDVEKKALALPDDSRTELFQTRASIISELFGRLSVYGSGQPEPFQLLSSLRKGIKVVARTLPLLDRGQLCVLLGDVFVHMEPFMVKDGEEQAQLYTSIRRVLASASLEMLIYLTSSLDKLYLDSILTKKLGSSCMWALISRGENIYKAVSPVDMEIEHHNAWLNFVQSVADSLREICVDSLSLPLPGSLLVEEHMSRLLDKKSLAGIEEHIEKIQPSRS